MNLYQSLNVQVDQVQLLSEQYMFAVLGVEVWSWLYELHEIHSIIFWLIDFYCYFTCKW